MTKKHSVLGINIFDWLLIIGLCLAPMTGLRIWKIGPAEILCFVWGLRYFSLGRSVKNDIFRFYIIFVPAMIIGSTIGFIINAREVRITDLLTWTYLGVASVLMYSGLKTKTLRYNEQMMSVFSYAAALWFLFLYIYSRVVKSTFFGVSLWFAGVRFTGGATNPHQVALLFCGLLFIYLRGIMRLERVALNLVFIIICSFLLKQTTSSTAIVAVTFGVAVFAFFFVVEVVAKRKTLAVILSVTCVVIVTVLFGARIFNFVMNWIESDPNGTGRVNIYKSFFEAFFKDPIFGLGPGKHGMSGTMEFHNTYLEVFTCTGLVGGGAFLLHTFRIIKKTIKSDWMLLPIIATIYAYGFGGFAMRRLIYWGFIVFATIIAEQISNEKANKTSLKDKQHGG
jgi:O-antigen ligase